MDEDASANAPTTPPAKDGSFDLSSLAYQDTSELVIEHPVTGQPTGWVWTVVGPAHRISIELSDEAARRVIKDRQRREAAQTNGKKWKPDEETPEGNREQNVEYFARRILSWNHPARLDGESLSFSQENVRKLLADPKYLWLYRQVTGYFTSDEAFIKASAKN